MSAKLEEEKPEIDQAKAKAEEARKLDDAIRAETDASTSDGNRTRDGTGGTGSPGGAGGGGGAGARPAFDRETASKRLADTPYKGMTKKVGDGETCIFSDLELELLSFDVAGLKKKATKDRKGACERFGAADAIELGKRKADLQDRASAWRKRALEREEEAWKAGKAQAGANAQEEAKRKFLESFEGSEPWIAYQAAWHKANEKWKPGPWFNELGLTPEDVGWLAWPTKEVATLYADEIFAAKKTVRADVLFAGTLAVIFLPKAWFAYQRWKAERDEAAKKAKEAKTDGTGTLGKEVAKP